MKHKNNIIYKKIKKIIKIIIRKNKNKIILILITLIMIIIMIQFLVMMKMMMKIISIKNQMILDHFKCNESL